jgi:WD40 repeat protein
MSIARMCCAGSRVWWTRLARLSRVGLVLVFLLLAALPAAAQEGDDKYTVVATEIAITLNSDFGRTLPDYVRLGLDNVRLVTQLQNDELILQQLNNLEESVVLWSQLAAANGDVGAFQQINAMGVIIDRWRNVIRGGALPAASGESADEPVEEEVVDPRFDALVESTTSTLNASYARDIPANVHEVIRGLNRAARDGDESLIMREFDALDQAILSWRRSAAMAGDTQATLLITIVDNTAERWHAIMAGDLPAEEEVVEEEAIEEEAAVEEAEPGIPAAVEAILAAYPDIAALESARVFDAYSSDVAWSPDAAMLFGHSHIDDMFVFSVWDVVSGEQLLTVEDGVGGAWSPDGRWLAVHMNSSPQIQVFDATTLEPVITLEGNEEPAGMATWSADGKLLVATWLDDAVEVWAAEAWETLTLLDTYRDTASGSTPFSLNWSPDGTQIATLTGGSDSVVWVWDVATGDVLIELADYKDGLWLPGDSGQVAVRPDRQSIEVRDGFEGEVLASYAHGASMNSQVWSPDGTRLVFVSQDDQGQYTNLFVWDATSGEIIEELADHADRVGGVVLSPDGVLMASYSRDGVVLVWDMASLAPVAALVGHTDGVSSAAWSPDGAQLVTASYTGENRFWDMSGLVE